MVSTHFHRAKCRGFSLLSMVVVIAYVSFMSALVADLVVQRYSLGESRFLPLDATRSQFLSLAGLEVIKWEVATNPDFTQSPDWCAVGTGPRQAPYTTMREYKLNYDYNESFFRIGYGPWNWSWYCNSNSVPEIQQILGSSLGRFCQAGGTCGLRSDWPGDNLRLFFRKTLESYEYNDTWWAANGDYRDTIINYASGGGNDNGGRVLLHTENTASWYYDQGYCATPLWKYRRYGWNPYYHGAYGGQYMGSNTGAFAPRGNWYRAIRWSRLAHTDPIPRSSHTVLSGSPWVYTGWDGYTYSRFDRGITVHLWIREGYSCSSASPCSLINKGAGVSNISYGLFLDSSADNVEFRLNFQGLGLRVLSLPYSWNAGSQWHYLVGTYDYATGVMRFYEAPKGGALQTVSANVGSAYLVANNYSIGISQDTNEQNRYNGYISEFRLTNYAMDVIDNSGMADLTQVNYWHNNTTNSVHAEEVVAGGCNEVWTQPSTTSRFENWW